MGGKQITVNTTIADALDAQGDTLKRLAAAVRNETDKTLEPPITPVLPPNAAFWTLPPETRVTVAQLAEMLGRPKSFIYRHIKPRNGCEPIPHRKLDGQIVVVLSQAREWVRRHEILGAA